MIATVRPYARARLKALGFKEWDDGINFENIPRTLLDTVFHIDQGQASGVSNNQDNLTVEVPFVIRLFRRGFRDPKTAIDEAYKTVDSVILEMLKPTNRLTQVEIKTVRFDRSVVEQLNISNDNSLVSTIEFTAIVIFNMR